MSFFFGFGGFGGFGGLGLEVALRAFTREFLGTSLRSPPSQQAARLKGRTPWIA